MKKVINFSALFLFLLPMLLVSCSKTPMEKLESSTIYSDMDQAYWVKQYDQKTQLWGQAVQYCMNNSDKPNCDSVNRVWMLGDSLQKKPVA